MSMSLSLSLFCYLFLYPSLAPSSRSLSLALSLSRIVTVFHCSTTSCYRSTAPPPESAMPDYSDASHEDGDQDDASLGGSDGGSHMEEEEELDELKW